MRQNPDRFITGTIFIVVLTLTILAGLLLLQPPRALPDTAPKDQFAAGRAMNHLRVIASHPHPVGSAYHDTVRDYLLQELRKLGLNSQVQATTSINGRKAAVIENIIAVSRGTANSKAVLLCAHYDARALAPGASDNGYAVAAILEILRALKEYPPLRNDLVILFTDGEEQGMLGVRSFVEEYPISVDIGLVLNFDARGASGASIMFETNNNNGWIVRQYNRAAAHRMATSLTYDVYRFMPYQTDFTYFLKKVPAGLNFANIGSVEVYHSIYDDVDHACQRTIQSTGTKMLSTVLYFGNTELDHAPAPDVVYFPFLFHRLIIYPVSFTVPLALVATALFFFVVVLGLRHKKINAGRLSLGFLVFMARIVIAGAGAFFLWNWLGPFHPEFGLYELHYIHQGDLYMVGFVLLGISAGLFFHHFMVRRMGVFNLSLGALFAWLILTWMTALMMPGGSYLFVWPLIFSLIACGWFLWRKEDSTYSPVAVLILSVCMIPGVFFFSQTILLLYESLTLAVVAGLTGLVVLLLGTLQIPIGLITDRKPLLLPVSTLLLTGGFMMAAFINRTPAEQAPKPNTIFYCLDSDGATAHWATWDVALDEFTGQFFSSEHETRRFPEFYMFDYYSPFQSSMVISDHAPVADMPLPVIDIIHDTVDAGSRYLKARISASEKACMNFIDITPVSGILALFLNDKPVDPDLDFDRFVLPLLWFGTGKYPAELTVNVLAGQSLQLNVVEVIGDIPEVLLQDLEPRPSWMIPVPGYQDATLVRKSVTIPASLPSPEPGRER